MPLIEAIKILKNISKEQVSEKKFWEAVGTLIEYAENESIPKEKVKEAIKYEKERIKEPADCGYSGTALHGYTARVLEELIGE